MNVRRVTIKDVAEKANVSSLQYLLHIMIRQNYLRRRLNILCKLLKKWDM